MSITCPYGSKVEAPRFQDNRHMKAVRWSAPRTSRLNPPANIPGNYFSCGPGSSFTMATYYGLDGPGSNRDGDEIYRLSRPALGPTQPPVKWVPDLYRG